MSSSSLRFFTFAAPARFYGLAGVLIPWCWAAFALLAAAGLYIGFFVAPTDARGTSITPRRAARRTRGARSPATARGS